MFANKTCGLLAIAFFLFSNTAYTSSKTNGGVGHSLDITRVKDSDVPGFLQENLFLDINGNLTNRRKVIKTHDFTGDNLPDKVVCHIASSSDNGVEIFDGKTGKRWFSWQVPDYNEKGQNRQFRGCSVFDLGDGRSAIAYAGVRSLDGYGLRGNEYQWIHYQNDNGGMSLTNVKRPDGKSYTPAARSVKCTEYPKNLVNQGYKAGGLCFYAGYDGPTPNGSGTMTALIKVEYKDGALKFKDLTASSGLRWVGGVYGTPYNHPNIMWTNGKSNNLSMLDGVFIDYDRDGYMDLGTGGAHSYSYMYRMVPDSSRSEGIRYVESANFGYEYAFRLQALNETERHLDSTCIYVADSYDDMKHYLRCYQDGKWIHASLDDDAFNAEDSSVNVLSDGKGKVYIHTMNSNRERFYRFKFKDDKIRRSIALTVEDDHIKISGFICRKNDRDFLPRMALTSKKESKSNGYKIYKNSSHLDKFLNRKQMLKCLSKQEGTTYGRFIFYIDKSELTSNNGSIWVHMNGDLGYSVKELKYKF